MADLYINLLEKITLGDVDRSVNTIQTIPNISYIDNRIFQLPSGSVTTIFSLSKKERAATSRKKAAGSRKGKQFIKNTEKAEYKKGTYHKK